MDIGQLLANGGIITVLGGLLYKLQDRRLKKLEDGKAEKEICQERHENIGNLHDKIDKRLDEGNKVMGKLETTTALLTQSVERMFKELEKQNGKKGD